MQPTQIETPDFVFEPNSIFWEITRERAILLAATRILLLQVAHPMVAVSVHANSYVFQNPVRRLHRTLDLTMRVIFGTRDRVEGALAEIEQAHRAATGRLETGIGSHADGAVYNPRNPRQALWVYATLIEGALVAYEQFIAPLDSVTRETYYQESLPFAHLMGVRESYLPTSYVGLLAYMDAAIQSGEVRVGDEAREIAHFLTGQSLPLVNFVAYPSYRVTVGLLPESLRQQYGYRFGHNEARLFERFCEMTRLVIPRLPDAARFGSEYLRSRRLLDQAQAG